MIESGMIPEMLTINQASKRTGLSYEYLRKLCIQKKIVYVRAGNRYLINALKLIEFLNSGEAGESDQEEARYERALS